MSRAFRTYNAWRTKGTVHRPAIRRDSEVAARMEGWTKDCFTQALDFLHRTHEILHLCMEGLGWVSKHPVVHEALLASMDGEPAATIEAEKRALDSCQRTAERARREIESHFVTLHSQSIVFLWACLDAFVEDLLAAWLRHEPQVLQAEDFRRIKVRVSDYQLLDEEQRAAFVVRELSRSLGAAEKRGVGVPRQRVQTRRLSAISARGARRLVAASRARWPGSAAKPALARVAEAREQTKPPAVALRTANDRSGDATKLDHGQVLATLDVAHGELETAAPSVAPNGPPRSRLEPAPWRGPVL